MLATIVPIGRIWDLRKFSKPPKSSFVKEDFGGPGCYQSAKKWATESPRPQSGAESGTCESFSKLPRVPCAKGVSSQTSYDYVVFIFPHSIQVNLSDVLKSKTTLKGGNLFARWSSELNPGLEPGDATASRWDHT